MERFYQGMERGFSTIDGYIKRVAMQPAQQLTTTAVGVELLLAGAAMKVAPAVTMMKPLLLMPILKVFLTYGMNTSTG